MLQNQQMKIAIAVVTRTLTLYAQNNKLRWIRLKWQYLLGVVSVNNLQYMLIIYTMLALWIRR